MNIIRKRVEDTHNHSCMSTHIEIIIPRMTNSAVHNSSCKTKKRLARHETNFIYKLQNKLITGWHIVVSRSSLEEFCVMILLGNNHQKLGVPSFIKKFTSLKFEILRLNPKNKKKSYI